MTAKAFFKNDTKMILEFFLFMEVEKRACMQRIGGYGVMQNAFAVSAHQRYGNEAMAMQTIGKQHNHYQCVDAERKHGGLKKKLNGGGLQCRHSDNPFFVKT